MFQRSFFYLVLLTIGLMKFGPLIAQEESKSTGGMAANPVVGTWDLFVRWGKGGDEKLGRHILTIKPDLSGEIKDVEEGWANPIRNLKATQQDVAFNFYYGDKEEYLIEFEGKVKKNAQGKKLEGSLSIFGTKGAVTGKPFDASEIRSIESKGSILDAYQARNFTSSEGDKINYRLFVPTNYDAEKEYPLILFHHGGGGAGNDNRSQLEGACVGEWIRPKIQSDYPCFIVAPQFPGKEEFAKKERGLKGGERVDGMKLQTRTIHEMLNSLEKEFSIDKNREYVTGLSFGGDCTWLSLFERPKRFAAAVPICGGYSLNPSESKKINELAGLPIWVFHGDADKVVPVRASREVVKVLTDARGKPRYTEYPQVGHYCWDRAYRDPQLISWLFAQSKMK
ncbi:alpha/beta hydrolase-fold protein [bacterium]|nr:alpha/beta hydrolase-fold protein [bacterium]